MRLDIRFLQPRANGIAVALDRSNPAVDGQWLVAICRPESVSTVPAGVIGLWWPLRGALALSTAEYTVSLGRREIYVSDALRAHDVFVHSGAAALSLLATPSTWAALLAAPVRCGDTRSAFAFPALHAVPRAFRRQLLGVARRSMTAPDNDERFSVYPALALLQTLQQRFLPEIQRCPGRNASQRRAVFLRLQRVRNLLSLSSDAELDMRAVAAAANYSLWRFIRVFAAVFGETPYAYVSRCRLDRARGMLQDGDLALGDVAAAVGYETSVALSRAMRRRYGVPASRLRGLERPQPILNCQRGRRP